MSKRYAFLLDMDKCIGCRGCAMACKNFNQLDPGMVWRQVYPLAESIYPHRERAFLSLSCNHCEVFQSGLVIMPICHEIPVLTFL